jgi:Domain of unknown function (DUF4145)
LPAVLGARCAVDPSAGTAPGGAEMFEGDSLGAGFGVITAKGVDLIENPPGQKQAAQSVSAKMTSAHCPKCGDEREALVLFTEENQDAVTYDPDAPPAVFYEKSDLLQCAGCKFVFLQKANWNTESEDEFGKPFVAIERFPKWDKEPIADWITSAAESSSGSAPIFQKLREVLLAYESGSYWLACVGSRSVLEAAMIEKVEDQGSFKANLDAYHAAGHITPSDKEQLKIVIEAEQGATRSFHPKREQVKIAIDIHVPDLTRRVCLCLPSCERSWKTDPLAIIEN